MFEEANGIKPPIDSDVVWRYMSIDSFLAMIVGRSSSGGVRKGILNFNALRVMSDPFEGLPQIGIESMDWNGIYVSTKNDGVPILVLNDGVPLFGFRDLVYISSWTLEPKENLLLWEKFGKNGIAVKSTIGQVRKAIAANNTIPSKDGLKFGKVAYMDKLRKDLVQKYNDIGQFNAEWLKRYKGRIQKDKPKEIMDVLDLHVRVVLEVAKEKGFNIENPQYFEFVEIKHSRFAYEKEFRFFFGYQQHAHELKTSCQLNVGDIDSMINEIKVSPESGEHLLICIKEILKALEWKVNVSKSEVKDLIDN